MKRKSQLNVNWCSVGDTIRIIEMEGEPQYSGKVGIVEYIDDIGQIHGTWGGCALIPGVDVFEVVRDGKTRTAGELPSLDEWVVNAADGFIGYWNWAYDAGDFRLEIEVNDDGRKVNGWGYIWDDDNVIFSAELYSYTKDIDFVADRCLDALSAALRFMRNGIALESYRKEV